MPNDDEQKHLAQEDTGDSDEADETEEILEQRPPQRSGKSGG